MQVRMQLVGKPNNDAKYRDWWMRLSKHQFKAITEYRQALLPNMRIFV